MSRILVVDDDDDVRELIELALSSGHEVDSVESGRAALERLAQHAYDLIVCDLHMSDRDGPAAATPAGVPVHHGLRRCRPLRGAPQDRASAPGTQAVQH